MALPADPDDLLTHRAEIFDQSQADGTGAEHDMLHKDPCSGWSDRRDSMNAVLPQPDARLQSIHAWAIDPPRAGHRGGGRADRRGLRRRIIAARNSIELVYPDHRSDHDNDTGRQFMQVR